MTAPVRAIAVTRGHGLWTGIAGYFSAEHRFGFGRRSGLLPGILVAAVFRAAYNSAVGASLLFGIGVLVVTAGFWGRLLPIGAGRVPARDRPQPLNLRT